MCHSLNGPTPARIVQSIVSILWLLSIAPAANAAVSGTAVLQGMWCNQDANDGETIVQYSAAGLEVTAFTVLSETDPRRIGRQSSMQLTIEARNVFLRRDVAGADEVFSVERNRLTVDSFRVLNRGTHEELRQPLTTQAYHRCDARKALQRAQAFLSSPQAEQATRKALQLEAERQAEVEQWQREDAETQERRNASQDAYYTDLIQQLSQARPGIGAATAAVPRNGGIVRGLASSLASAASTGDRRTREGADLTFDTPAGGFAASSEDSGAAHRRPSRSPLQPLACAQ